jgi:arginyl-tRNA synthetase
VLRRLGFEETAKNLVHLAYEHVGLPDQKFSGRAGTWIGYTADDLLAEAKQKVSEKIKGELSEQERTKVIDAVGAGAIKFTFLRTNSEKKIIFTWEEALNMEGDSGPYVQYAYVRTRSLMNKSSEKPGIAKGYLFTTEEKLLLKRLAAFSEVLQRCSKDMAPHHLCQYMLDVAGDFSGFYNTSQVLKAEKHIMKTRLAIVEATNTVLGSSLNLLGMERPERM